MARPQTAEADGGLCRYDNYLEFWLGVDAIFHAYVDSEFRVDSETTGYHLEVTRVWKGRAPTVVTAYTGLVRRDPGRGHLPRQRVTHNGTDSHRLENLVYYKEGYQPHLSGPSIGDGCGSRHLAEEFVGSELAALRIIYYSLWGATVVGTAVLALILRAAWRRRAVG